MARSCESFTGGLRLLLKNQQLALAVCAAGLQQSCTAVTETFSLAALRAGLWGTHMSEYAAATTILFSIVAMTLGGPFGRFSDHIDRRVAATISGALAFLPGWIVIPFVSMGMPYAALWSSTVVKILGAFTVSSNVLLALANDVTASEDRDVAVGVYFAGTNLIMLLLNGIPVLLLIILKVVETTPVYTMVYLMVLSLVYFFCLWSIKMPEKNPHMSEKDRESRLERGETMLSRAPKGVSVSSSFGSSQGAGTRDTSLRAMIAEPVKLALSHRRLKRLFLAAFLISFSGDLIMDIGGQYFNTSLNLLPYGTEAQFMMLSAVTMIPGALLVIPGYMITGQLAKTGGTLRLLTRLIPCSGLLTLSGALVMLVPPATRWYFIPLIVVFQNYASLVNVPLLRMVAGTAPIGRVGEALASVGVASQTSNLVGNLFVVVINPILLATPWEDPLWLYYPTCTLIVLCALIPVCMTPKGGWGAASGRVEDVLFATTMARVAATRWRAQATAARVHQVGQDAQSPFPKSSPTACPAPADNDDKVHSKALCYGSSSHSSGLPVLLNERVAMDQEVK